MKNYKDSDYAVNKHAKGIVYRFADQTVEITLEDYLRENPGKREADFMELKDLSDKIYENQVRDENRQTYKNTAIQGLEETDAFAVLSPEDILIGQTEQAEKEKQRKQIAKTVWDSLTEVQRRRYYLHAVKGFSTWEIAAKEGTNQKSVYESLQAAEKKIKKVFGDA